jgi:hypothetical protein
VITIITGKFISTPGSNNESTFDLSNGWRAVLTFSEPYQREFVKSLSKGSFRWICSKGIADLPEFARAWLMKDSKCVSLQDCVAVGFTKVW